MQTPNPAPEPDAAESRLSEREDAWPALVACEHCRRAMPLSRRVERLEQAIDRMSARLEEMISVLVALERGHSLQPAPIPTVYQAAIWRGPNAERLAIRKTPWPGN